MPAGWNHRDLTQLECHGAGADMLTQQVRNKQMAGRQPIRQVLMQQVSQWIAWGESQAFQCHPGDAMLASKLRGTPANVSNVDWLLRTAICLKRGASFARDRKIVPAAFAQNSAASL